MSRGFLSGVFWGGVVSVAALGTASLYLPPPSSGVGPDLLVNAPQAGQVDTVGINDVAPNLVTSQQSSPALEAPNGQLDAAVQPDAPASIIKDDSLPDAQTRVTAVLPSKSVVNHAPRGVEDTRPHGSGLSSLAAPAQPDADVKAPDVPEPRIESRSDVVVAPPANDVTVGPSGLALSGEVPELQQNLPVVTGRLPSIGNVTPPDSAAPEVEAPKHTTALAENAASFRDRQGPLFSVTLIDTGVAVAEITDLGLPVTIALDPTAPDAAERMARYRGQGIETVALLSDLPEVLTPSDVLVAMSQYLTTLDKVIGVMDPLDGRIQTDRALLVPVLDAIHDSGHGFITYNRGLNQARAAAIRAKVPVATIMRVLDAEGERAEKIIRYLDRATFNSTADGQVVVVGHTYPETLRALKEWTSGRQSPDPAQGSGIVLAPVSAVLRDSLSD